MPSMFNSSLKKITFSTLKISWCFFKKKTLLYKTKLLNCSWKTRRSQCLCCCCFPAYFSPLTSMQYFFIFPVVLCSHIVHPVFSLSWWASFSILFWILYWIFIYIHLIMVILWHIILLNYLILLFGMYSVVSAFNLIVSCLSNSRQNSHLSYSWRSGYKQDESSHSSRS